MRLVLAGSRAAGRAAQTELLGRSPASLGASVARLHPRAAAPAVRMGLRAMSGSVKEGGKVEGGVHAAAQNEGQRAAHAQSWVGTKDAAGLPVGKSIDRYMDATNVELGTVPNTWVGHQEPQDAAGLPVGKSIDRYVDATHVELGTVPNTWVGRMIGYHGEAIKHLEAKTSAVFKFHQRRDASNQVARGTYDVRVTMSVPVGLEQPAEAMFNSARYMQTLRDEMAAFSYENRHWNSLHTFMRLRRDSNIVDLPLAQADYNLALSMCGIVCQAQAAESIYGYLVSTKEKYAKASPRTWSIFCGAVVAAGDIAPAVGSLDLAVERGNVVSRGEALALLENEVVRSRAPRVTPSLQLILALHADGRPYSDQVELHAREMVGRATDALVAQHRYAKAVAGGARCPMANALMLQLALQMNQVVPAAGFFEEYLALLPEGGGGEAALADAQRMLADVLSCCAWWRRLDLAERCWEVFAARGLSADRRAHSARVLALSNCGKFGRMYAALHEMAGGVGTDVNAQLTEAIAESMALSRGRVADASDELRKFAKGGGGVPVSALVAAVSAVGRVIDLKSAFELYEALVPSLAGGRTSISVFNALLSLCALHGRLDAAEATLGHVKACGLQPNADSYAYLVRTALRAGDVTRAVDMAKMLAPVSGETGPQSQSEVVSETVEMLCKVVVGVSGSVEERAAAIYRMMGVDDHVWKVGGAGGGQEQAGAAGA